MMYALARQVLAQRVEIGMSAIRRLLREGRRFESVTAHRHDIQKKQRVSSFNGCACVLRPTRVEANWKQRAWFQ
jgi:hypothetical protein